MRARITTAFVALLAVALILAGGVSLLLVRHAQSVSNQRIVGDEAKALVAGLEDKNVTLEVEQQIFTIVKDVAELQSESVITIGGRPGNYVPTGLAETGIPASLVNLSNIVAGKVVTGTHDHVAFAVVKLFSTLGTPKITVALMLQAKQNFGASPYYFLLAGGISLLAAAILSSLISRRIARRVVAVAEAAGRIADGDLATRLEGQRHNYPEIVRLDRAINTMAENLERSQRAERDFLLSVSHDLRTPLTSIRGYSEAIADGATPDPAHAAAIVVSEAGRLERLIGDLLDLARMRARTFALDESEIDLVEAVRGAAEALRLACEGAAVALEIEMPERPVRRVADAHRISQIVANLTENALKYATSSVVVSLAELPDGRLEIAVSDDGPGIAADDLPHVFERLFTSQRFAARASGTGLGLAIVAELSDAMGATVTIDSPTPTGPGTRLAVTFPAAAGVLVEA